MNVDAFLTILGLHELYLNMNYHCGILSFRNISKLEIADNY